MEVIGDSEPSPLVQKIDDPSSLWRSGTASSEVGALMPVPRRTYGRARIRDDEDEDGDGDPPAGSNRGEQAVMHWPDRALSSSHATDPSDDDTDGEEGQNETEFTAAHIRRELDNLQPRPVHAARQSLDSQPTPVNAALESVPPSVANGIVSRMKTREEATPLRPDSTPCPDPLQARPTASIESSDLSTLFTSSQTAADRSTTSSLALSSSATSTSTEAEDVARLFRKGHLVELAESRKRAGHTKRKSYERSSPSPPSDEKVFRLMSSQAGEARKKPADSPHARAAPAIALEPLDLFELDENVPGPSRPARKLKAEMEALSTAHEREMAETRRSRSTNLARGEKKLPLTSFFDSYGQDRATDRYASVPIRIAAEIPVRAAAAVAQPRFSSPIAEIRPTTPQTRVQSSSIDDDLPDTEDIGRERRERERRDRRRSLKMVAAAGQTQPTVEDDDEDIVLVQDSQQRSVSARVQEAPDASLAPRPKSKPQAKAVLREIQHDQPTGYVRKPDERALLLERASRQAILARQEAASLRGLAPSAVYDTMGVLEKRVYEERRHRFTPEPAQSAGASQDADCLTSPGEEEGGRAKDNEMAADDSGEEVEDEAQDDLYASGSGSEEEDGSPEPDGVTDDDDVLGEAEDEKDSSTSIETHENAVTERAALVDDEEDEGIGPIRKTKRSRATVLDDEEDQTTRAQDSFPQIPPTPQDIFGETNVGLSQFFKKTQLEQRTGSQDQNEILEPGGLSQFFKASHPDLSPQNSHDAFAALRGPRSENLVVKGDYQPTQIETLPSGLLQSASLDDSQAEGAAAESLDTRPRLYMNDDGFFTQNPPTFTQYDNVTQDRATDKALSHPQDSLPTLQRGRKLVRIAQDHDADLDESESPELIETLPELAASAPKSQSPKLKDAFDLLKENASRGDRSDGAHAEQYLEEEASESDEDALGNWRGSGSEDEDEEDDDGASVQEQLIDDNEVDPERRAEQDALAREKYVAHLSADDAANQKLQMDATTGVLRQRRRNVLLDDDAEDDVDELNRREELKEKNRNRKRKVEGEIDELDEASKDPAKAAFVSAYHDRGEDREEDESYLDREQPLQIRGHEAEDDVSQSQSDPPLQAAKHKNLTDHLREHAKFENKRRRQTVLDEDEESDLEIIDQPASVPRVPLALDDEDDERMLRTRPRGSLLDTRRSSRLAQNPDADLGVGKLSNAGERSRRAAITSYLKPIATRSKAQTGTTCR